MYVYMERERERERVMLQIFNCLSDKIFKHQNMRNFEIMAARRMWDLSISSSAFQRVFGRESRLRYSGERTVHNLRSKNGCPADEI